MNTNPDWEHFTTDNGDDVRRLPVPGGWLYQVERIDMEEENATGTKRRWTSGWHPPVFVPDVHGRPVNP